jgi:Ca2+-binding EF-hand superfamily protein
MPLTPFQKHKIRQLFSVLDVNRDGRVDRNDFIRRVQALARLSGWTEGSPEYRRNLDYVLQEWESIRDSADLDDSGAITVDEYLRYADIFLDDRDAVRAYARGDVQLLFDAMDRDCDGSISLEEYRAYLVACGVDASAADVFFAHADLDEDGYITRREMAHAVEEFLISEDRNAAGNFMFGPLPPETTAAGAAGSHDERGG